MSEQSVWIIERKEFGYRPFQDGDWEIYTCAGYGLQDDALEEIKRLQENADEYTYYRAAKYLRSEPAGKETK